MRLLSPVVLLSVSATALGADKVQFACNGAGWPPFLQTDGGRVTGIFPGIMQAATKSFGYDLELAYGGLTTPNDWGAEQAAKEKRNVVCSGPATENWIAPDIRKRGQFTAPIFRTSDELWFSVGKTPREAKTLADLKGLRIGACKGYSYAPLEESFKAGTLTRVDFEGESGAPCEQLVVKAVLDGRVVAGIANRHVLGFLVKNGKLEPGKLERFVVPVEVAHLKLICSKNPASDVFLRKLAATMEKIEKDGTVESIVKKYVAE